jgi:hypothetical protein
VLSVRGSCLDVGVSTVYMHAQPSKARVTGQFKGEYIVFFFALLVCVALCRLPREGFNGMMRPKALNVWGKPVRLAASRVSCTLCRRLALLGASPGFSMVASDR